MDEIDKTGETLKQYLVSNSIEGIPYLMHNSQEAIWKKRFGELAAIIHDSIGTGRYSRHKEDPFLKSLIDTVELGALYEHGMAGAEEAHKSIKELENCPTLIAHTFPNPETFRNNAIGYASMTLCALMLNSRAKKNDGKEEQLIKDTATYSYHALNAIEMLIVKNGYEPATIISLSGQAYRDAPPIIREYVRFSDYENGVFRLPDDERTNLNSTRLFLETRITASSEPERDALLRSHMHASAKLMQQVEEYRRSMEIVDAIKLML